MSRYSSFKVLLDAPASNPGLGFVGYAEAFAGIAHTSNPQFAIGIFGDWGSGKTTLMRSMQDRLQRNDDVVTVWFNAWRYEREEHLIVPLLDILRESLVRRAADAKEKVAQGAFRRAADHVSRAGKAFLAGVSVTAKLPVVGLEASIDPAKVVKALRQSTDSADDPLSFYQAAFNMLGAAMEEFSEAGARRVVVFVDDLDRCLPERALQVLESMKLFFDLEGFVFVVGLDQSVVERAVAWKYAAASSATAPPISGTEYIKKIFQVPFALPRITTDRLQEYLESVMSNSSLPPEQTSDFHQRVRGHLTFLQGEDSVNPREIKRLVNSYVLQLKMLEVGIGEIDPDLVLALQSLTFRPDWRDIYEILIKDPPLFQSAVKSALSDGSAESVWIAGQRIALPSSFIDYVQGIGAPLLASPTLTSYVLAAESTGSTDPLALEAQTTLGRLRGVSDRINSAPVSSELVAEFGGHLRRLRDVASRRSATSLPQLFARLEVLDNCARELPSLTADDPDGLKAWADRVTPQLEGLDVQLRELRRATSVSPVTA